MPNSGENGANESTTIATDRRADALRARARAIRRFCARRCERVPEIADAFLSDGAAAAAELALAADGDDARRRRCARSATDWRWRSRSAISPASLPLEQVTRLLSDFADRAIDRALGAAIARARARTPSRRASRSSPWASSAATSSIIRPTSTCCCCSIPRRCRRRARDDAGEAAVRIGRRMIELLQKRTADGYVAARRPAAAARRPKSRRSRCRSTPRSRITNRSALPWERAAFIRARAAAGDIALGQRFLDAIQPFVWRRSLDFGVIDEVRQISARIRDHFAQGPSIGPGYDLKRGRGGIREVEFFVQIQQMIHGGRDASVRAPATLDAIEALVAAGRLDAGDGARACATPIGCCARSSTACRWSTMRRPTCLPAQPRALDNVARLHGLASGARAARAAAARTSSASATIFDSLAPDERRRLSNDPRHPAPTSCASSASPTPKRRRGTSADWRSGKARSLRSPAAQQAFEAMLPGLLAGDRRGRRSRPRAQPPRATSSSGCRAGSISSACSRRGRRSAQLLAKILAHAPALADQLARRPELFEGLFDASSFAMPPDGRRVRRSCSRDAMRGQPYDVALDRVRRLVNERRFALGVQLIDRRRDPLEVTEGYARVAEGALVALGRRRGGEFEDGARQLPGGELIDPRPRPARRPFADPRVRPRHHLSAHAPRRAACPTAPSRSGPTIISTGWRAGSPPR